MKIKAAAAWRKPAILVETHPALLGGHENVVLSFGAALLQKKPAVCGELHLWQTQEIFHELQLESDMGNHPNAGHLFVEAQPPTPLAGSRGG